MRLYGMREGRVAAGGLREVSSEPRGYERVVYTESALTFKFHTRSKDYPKQESPVIHSSSDNVTSLTSH